MLAANCLIILVNLSSNRLFFQDLVLELSAIGCIKFFQDKWKSYLKQLVVAYFEILMFVLFHRRLLDEKRSLKIYSFVIMIVVAKNFVFFNNCSTVGPNSSKTRKLYLLPYNSMSLNNYIVGNFLISFKIC